MVTIAGRVDTLVRNPGKYPDIGIGNNLTLLQNDKGTLISIYAGREDPTSPDESKKIYTIPVNL
jgi:hypothetical protein